MKLVRLLHMSEGAAALLIVLSAFTAAAQEPAAADAPSNKVYRSGRDVSQPKLLSKVDPQYSPEALSAQVQGTCVLEIVIDENGAPSQITVLSPVGFGLDERAQTAVASWRFAPGQRNGQPVKVSANVEVNFRLSPSQVDLKQEQRRTSFNVALSRSRNNPGDPAQTAKLLDTLKKLADQKYGPAEGVLGSLYLTGDLVGTKDPERAKTLLEASAKKHYGPALYWLGKMYQEGNQYPADPDRALKLFQQAAQLGSIEAQYTLGKRYETGDGVTADPARAQRNYRLCAAAGDARCQFALAKALLTQPARREQTYVQALAWCQIAADKGVAGAKQTLAEELPKLTDDQKSWMQRLVYQLARKPS